MTWAVWTRLLATLIALAGAGVSAQAPVETTESQFLGQTWESEEGFPDIGAVAFAQTPDGYLWVGTFSQLLRFDGRAFTKVTAPEAPGLENAMVLAMHVDGKGRLWVGTTRGVGRLEAGVWRWWGEAAGVPVGIVRDILSSDRGELLIAVENEIRRWDGDARFEAVPLPLPSRRSGAPLRIAMDGSGRLWAMDHAWLAVREAEAWSVLFHDVEAETGDSRLLGMAPAQDGGMWVARDVIVSKWRDGEWTESWVRPETNRIGAVRMIEDRHQGLWIGSYVAGLIRVDRPSGEIWSVGAADELRNPSIIGLDEDREGNVWVGTNGGGITRLRPRTVVLHGQLRGLTQPVVNSFVPDGNGFLLATHGGGLVRWEDGRFTPATWNGRTLERGWPQCLVADGAGGWWVGTFSDGLFHVETGTGQIRAETGGGTEFQHVLSLHRRRSGELWVAHDRGLSRRSGGDGSWTHWDPTTDGAPTRGIRYLAEDAEGTMWAAGPGNGLWLWREGEPRPHHVAHGAGGGAATEPDFGRIVMGLAADPKDGLWLALGNGVIEHRTSQRTRAFDAAAGLPTEMWGAIAFDREENLWLGGSTMLARVSAASLAEARAGRSGALEVGILDHYDGFPPSGTRVGFQPVVQQDEQGHLWFATYKGLARVDPSRMPDSNYVPPAHIERIETAEQTYLIDASVREVKLPPGTRRATVRYTGVLLGTPARVRFAVRIPGVDDDWVEVGDTREAQLIDFSPGRYVVQVRAWQGHTRADPNHVAQIVVVIAPAWWETWWFRMGAGGAILGGVAALVVLINRGRRRRYEERVAQLEALENERREAREARLASTLADAASRAKSDFLATMSHEIRTPLIGVIGSAELLEGTRLDDEQRLHLRTLQASASSLLGLVSDILDFSKIEAGKVELEQVPFDLPRLLEEVAGIGALRVQGSELELGLVIDPRLPRIVMGDPVRIRQILLNLLSNALKFTARGEVCLRAAPAAGAPEHGIRFSVTDTGIGISAEALQRIMERFTQADTTTARRFGGSGLGLSICRSLLDLMGGELTVRSTEGAGSDFSFSLHLPPSLDELSRAAPFQAPEGWFVVVLERSVLGADTAASTLSRLGVVALATTDPAEAAAAIAASTAPHTILIRHELAPWPPPSVGEPRVVDTLLLHERDTRHHRTGAVMKPLLNPHDVAEGFVALGKPWPLASGALPAPAGAEPKVGVGTRSPLHILLVDDELVSRHVSERLLTRLGYVHTSAADGEEAVSLVRRQRFDLVLMDCQMPRLNGYEATAQIRDLGGHGATVPIIALTANVVTESRDHCFAMGMNDFVAKPVRLAELDAVLRRWLPSSAGGGTGIDATP